MVDDQDHDGTHHCNQDAVQVDARDTCHAECLKQVAADNRTHDAQDDVQQEPFTGFIDDLAADKSRNEAEYDPGDVDARWIDSRGRQREASGVPAF